MIQYLWRDDPVNTRGQGSAAYAGWQSGLYSFDGRKKPLRDAFPNVFWVDLPKGKKTATVWGQVRPGDSASVTVQKKNGSSWSTLRSLKTDSNGYFVFTTAISKKTSLRYRYSKADATTAKVKTFTSSVMTVGRKIVVTRAEGRTSCALVVGAGADGFPAAAPKSTSSRFGGVPPQETARARAHRGAGTRVLPLAASKL